MNVGSPRSSDDVDTVIAAFRDGRPVVLLDDLGPHKGHGALLIAGELADADSVGFMTRHSSGYVSVALPHTEADRLDIPPMYALKESADGIDFGVSVDGRSGVSTGISAADRARTIRLLAAADNHAADFSRPGHIATVRTRAGGLLTRLGAGEAAVDLARVAGLRPIVAMAVVVSADRPTELAEVTELVRFSDAHGLARLRLSALTRYLSRHDQYVVRAGRASMPIEAGTFTAFGYRSTYDDREHVAFVMGDPDDATCDVLVRIQSECALSDVFGSRRCTCRAELEASLAIVAGQGCGVVVYVREHERSGGGLVQKLAAYEELDSAGSAAPVRHQGEPPGDPRDASIAAQILLDLGIRRLRLLVSAPAQASPLRRFGLEVVDEVPILPTGAHDTLASNREAPV